MRKHLLCNLPADTLLDEFMLSVEVLTSGYLIHYVPEAYAVESGSLSISEEWKRKVRIGAGGIQSTLRSFSLANPFRFGLISYTYLIHRIARWTIAPLATAMAMLSGSLLFLNDLMFAPIIVSCVLFSLTTLVGIKKSSFIISKKLSFITYFLMMNVSVIAGWWRFFTGKQTVIWEKAKR